jgi:hypothetical protein
MYGPIIALIWPTQPRSPTFQPFRAIFQVPCFAQCPTASMTSSMRSANPPSTDPEPPLDKGLNPFLIIFSVILQVPCFGQCPTASMTSMRSATLCHQIDPPAEKKA